eukprot:493222-Pyramimonas_sp.AAC.1
MARLGPLSTRCPVGACSWASGTAGSFAASSAALSLSSPSATRAVTSDEGETNMRSGTGDRWG